VETKRLIPICFEVMREAQLTSKFCQEVLKHGSMFGHKVVEDCDGLIVRVVDKVGIAGTNQAVGPECLRKRVLEPAPAPSYCSSWHVTTILVVLHWFYLARNVG
jgi:hypothetical protein